MENIKQNKTPIEPLDINAYQEKKCKWSLDGNNNAEDPHYHNLLAERKKIYNNIIEAINWSPMVKLNKIPKSEGVKCEVVVKCEFYLPGGSLKDRIGKRMIEEAERKGLITPGVSTIIEATSGNTGIGLALNGAVKGYNVIITLPEKMSQEKSDVLAALGAKIIRTPTEASFVDVDSHIGVARTLNQEIPNSIILDQYCNPGNALAHYDETAEEIWAQTEGKVDYVVMTAGTGGTITGISRKLKEKNPNIQIIGVDPVGSILALPEELNKEGIGSYKVEGIGYDFIPKNCDREGNIDKWLKSNDTDSFKMARRLIREEGLLVGGSSGAAVDAAIKVAMSLPEDKRVVVICTDSVRNYMTKFLNDDWMLENNFTSIEDYDAKHFSEDTKVFGEGKKIRELNIPKVETVGMKSSVRQVVKAFKENNCDCLPVKNESKEVIGLVTQRTITTLLANMRLDVESPISKAVQKEFKRLSLDDSVKYLSKSFNRHQYVLVEGDGSYYICEDKHLLNSILA